MASPQTTATTTTATTAQRTAPARTGTIFGIVGAVLAIAGFILPWTLQPQVDLSPPGPLSYSTASGWDIAIILATGSWDFNSKQTTAPLYSTALLVAAPALLAVVVLVVCAISLRRQPGPVLMGLFSSAAVLGVLSIFEIYSTYSLGIPALALLSSTPSDVSPWVGIGSVVLYLGYFGIIAGCVITLLSHRQSASQG